jgi:transcriptional regulator with XRE-family HTH domain
VLLKAAKCSFHFFKSTQMSARNRLTEAIPYAVESSLRRLGGDLKLARLRRNLTIDTVATRIGTGRRAVMDAEKGKPTTGIVVYAALLWAYDLIGQLDEVAEPARDTEGLRLARASERSNARSAAGAELDNDF